MGSSTDSAKPDGPAHSPLGMVAGAYHAWFTGSAYGGVVDLLAGIAATGLEGAYAGVVLGVAVGSATCLFSGRLYGRILGGLFVGAAAVSAGLTLGLPAGVGGGALAGFVPALAGAGRLDFSGAPGDGGWLRWAMWVALGAIAGAAGMSLLDSCRCMEL